MKFLLTGCIVCLFTAVSLAQQSNYLGVTYAARYFPFANFNTDSESGKYKRNLPENVLKLSFKTSLRNHERICFLVSSSYSYNQYQFEKFDHYFGASSGPGYGEGSSTQTDYSYHATYAYSFFGLESGFFYSWRKEKKISFGLGLSVSVNQLIGERTFNKEKSWKITHTVIISGGPDAGTYTSVTSGSNNDVKNLRTTMTNGKLEIPFSVFWNFERSQLQFSISPGISTKCRDAIYDSEINLFISPQIGYFVKLGKSKTNAATLPDN